MADLAITVLVCTAPAAVQEWMGSVPAGSTVAQALALLALPAPADGCSVGVWGKVVSSDQVLRNGDRIEIYRPLVVDPKMARRQRFVAQGRRTAGLFARRQPE